MQDDSNDAETVPGVIKAGRWLPWMLLVAGLIATFFVIAQYRAGISLEMKYELDLVSNEIQAKIKIRIDACEQLLLGGAAFLEGSDVSSRSEWRQYVERQKIGERFQGIQGIGFSLFLPATALPQHLRNMHSGGYPDYSVWPVAEKESYSPIIFFEPFSNDIPGFFGYDMSSEPKLWEAMEQARDLDSPILSGQAILGRETRQSIQTATLLYVPVYRTGLPTDTNEQRSAALQGWIYCQYQMHELMGGILGDWNESPDRRMRLEILDVTEPSSDTLLYDSHVPEPDQMLRPVIISAEALMRFWGREWLLRFSYHQLHSTSGRLGGVLYIFFSGAVISLLMFWLARNQYLAIKTGGTGIMELDLTTNRLYDGLARNIPAGLFILHSEPTGAFTFDYVSPKVAEILDLSIETILADPWSAFKPIHPDEVEDFVRLNRENLVLQQPFNWEGRILAGSIEKWIRISSTPEHVQDGNILWNGILTEITEQKKIQHALQESERKFRTIAEKLESVIFITDQVGRLEYISPASTQVFGFLPEEMTGKEFLEFLPGEEIPRAMQAFHAALDTKKASKGGLDLFMKRSDGSLFVGELITTVITNDTCVVGTLGLISDITERKYMEKMLQDREENLRTAQRLANIGSWVWTASDNSMVWSEQLFKIFRYDPSKPIPPFSDMSSFVTPESWTRFNEEVAKQYAAGNPFELDIELVCTEGSTRYATARGEADMDEHGNFVGMHGTVQDITDRKEAEIRIKRLLEEKELILKEVHHRIKNNMNTMKSLLTLQAHTLKDPSMAAALEDAAGRMQSMAVLYDKLYQSTAFGTISIKCYFEELIDQVVSNFPYTIPITIEKLIDDIILDVKKMQTAGIVLNELLTNIMKYAFAGRQRGTIRVEVSIKEHLVSMIIQDDGQGMPSTVDFKNSPGFGIMLVGALTEQLDGNIHIERINGTRITLEFPA